MRETWLQKYIFLAFHIHRAMQKAYACPFVEAYYGPATWRVQVEAEPEKDAADLVREAMMLADALTAQGFDSNRASYLSKHVGAMETLCRKLCGEVFSLEEEALSCLDIRPVWMPEAQFEQAHTLYEAVLSGTGNLAERLHAYRTSLAFPLDRADALRDFIDRAFAEARKRTQALFELPEGERIEVEYFPEKEYDAAARYQGNYRTHIEMNIAATAAYLSRLFDHKVCHEGYPGHHTEYTLKEQQLARQEGYAEQTIVLTLCPQCVVTEGIAMIAHEMIFSEGEAEQWIVEHVYHSLHKDVDATLLLRLRQASEMLQGVWDNALILLDEGRPEQEVIKYCAEYMLLDKDKAAQMVAHLKHPLWGRYSLTYASGQKLVRLWLQGPNRIAAFRRLLTEQLVPSQLRGEALSDESIN